MQKTSPPASPALPRGPLLVQRVPLASLAPDPGNARTHPQANVDAMAVYAGLAVWGFVAWRPARPPSTA
jgi:hypothetical protein